MNPIEKIQFKFKQADIVEKLIYINIAVFIFIKLYGVFAVDLNGIFLSNWIGLSSNLNDFLIKPWTIITYGFVHIDFIHLIFNLIVLYFVGNLFLDYFSEKQLLYFYLLGTVFGGLFYLGYYNIVDNNSYSQLVGASAGIAAILIGITTHIPQYDLKFSLLGFVKLWVIAAIWMTLSIIQLSGSNTGGNLAHLGAGLFGYIAVAYSIKLSKKSFSSIFKKKSPLKTAYKAKQMHSNVKTNLSVQNQIDEILDKISKSGYDSLSKEDKEFLFRQKDS